MRETVELVFAIGDNVSNESDKFAKHANVALATTVFVREIPRSYLSA